MRMLCLIVGWLFCFVASETLIVAAEHPHVLIILVDDMGYGDPGCFNDQSKIATPHIDSLAKGGLRFTDAHAPGPLCHLSRYGLMTGTYPFRTNVAAWRNHAVIKSDQMTVPKLLKRAGYRTAMVGKWHLGFEENGYDKPLPGGPVDVGFDSFFGIRASTDIPPYFYIRDDRAVQPPTEQIAANNSEGWSPIQGAFWRAGRIAPDLQLEDVTPRFTEEAIRVIDDHVSESGNDPLFLYLAYPSPHTPWLPSEPFRGQSGAGSYGDFLMMVDDQIGQVLAALEEADMSDDTLVIFTSDNGPVWYPDDAKKYDHDSCGGLRGMKSDVWEAGHRMPFIVRWPGQADEGGSTDQMVCFTDVLATLADVVDQPLRSTEAIDSFTFLPALQGRKHDSESDSRGKRSELVTPSGGSMRGPAPMMAVRKGHWKFINALGSGGFTKPSRVQPEPGQPTGQLYDLSVDPQERNNVFANHPERVDEMTRLLKDVQQRNVYRP